MEKEEIQKQNERRRGFEKDVVDYFKGKDILKADRLLVETARNNFKVGKEEGKTQALKDVKKFLNDFDFLSEKFIPPINKKSNEEVNMLIRKEIQKQLGEMK